MASARDVVFAAAIFFILGIIFFVVNFVTNTAVNNLIQVPAFNNTAVAKTALTDTQDVANTRFDGIFLAFFFGFILTILITGWFVGGNPIFMVFYFIVTVVAVLVSMIFANTWYDVTTNTVIFGTTINNMPITNHILSYLPVYIAVIGIMGMIVMFSKPYVVRQL